MAFALRKSGAENLVKRSPLAGWLGKKQQEEPEFVLPEADVQAGLSRALRGSGAQPEITHSHAKFGPVRDALGAIEAALYTIDNVRDVIEQACDVALSAKEVDDIGGRALLAESYDELRLSINKVLENADERAKGLVGKNGRHVDVKLGLKAHYSVSAVRIDTSERGLNLSPPREAFDTEEEIDMALEQLDKALSKADRAAAGYCRDAQFLIDRMNNTAA